MPVGDLRAFHLRVFKVEHACRHETSTHEALAPKFRCAFYVKKEYVSGKRNAVCPRWITLLFIPQLDILVGFVEKRRKYCSFHELVHAGCAGPNVSQKYFLSCKIKREDLARKLRTKSWDAARFRMKDSADRHTVFPNAKRLSFKVDVYSS